MLNVRSLSLMALGFSLWCSLAAAQYVDGPQPGPNGTNLQGSAMANRMLGGSRSRTSSGPVVGPYQALQQQQMIQQQQQMQQAYANAQATAQKKAEKKEKLRQNILIQREKDAAKREALKEKNIAAAAEAKLKSETPEKPSAAEDSSASPKTTLKK